MNAASIRANEILSRLGANPCGAELGVAHGQLSSRLLVRSDLRLIMVDSWGVYRDTFKPSQDYFADLSKAEQENNKRSARYMTEFAEDRRTIIEADTIAAASHVPDGSLDFVFVDADHSYEGCRGDIEAWFPKLKPGGLLCGHDYAHKDFPKWGVHQAVGEFAEKHGFVVDLGADWTWFIRLPGTYVERSDCYNEIIVACVKHGPLYGAEYVNVLADMVARNLHIPARFVCLTDDPSGLDDGIEIVPIPAVGLKGWWNKCRLFAPGVFPRKSRVVFLDLDVVVTGSLDDLVRTKGISHDWLQGGYNSSVMVWDEGEYRVIWDRLSQGTMDRLHGDQDWIGECSMWAYLPPDWVVSYRLHSQTWPPEGAKIVAFHGQPKPADIKTGWVPELWQMNGLAQPKFFSELNNDVGEMRANVETNKLREIPGIEKGEPRKNSLVIVGGGPSAADSLMSIQLLKAQGAEVWALNGAHDWLISKGIMPDAMVLLDSRPDNVSFVANARKGIRYYIATQCAPAVFDHLKRKKADVRKWTAWLWGVHDDVMIGGGATVGLKALCLAYVLGFRQFKLFGYDSSYRGDENHAYPQPLNGTERRIDVVLQGQKFVSAAWMVKQVREFQDLSRTLIGGGCELEVFGDGLLQTSCALAVAMAAKNDAA